MRELRRGDGFKAEDGEVRLSSRKALLGSFSSAAMFCWRRLLVLASYISPEISALFERSKAFFPKQSM